METSGDTCHSDEEQSFFNLPLNFNPQLHEDIYRSSAMIVMFPPPVWSVADRLGHVLSLLRGKLSGGTLVQLWIPILEQGGECVLSTNNQPYYLVDPVLASYRKHSTTFTFQVDSTTGLLLGLPGRVFMSKVPEWTSDVNLYKSATEFWRLMDANLSGVRSCMAMPIVDPSNGSCCAVIELATTIEKPNFDEEMICLAGAAQALGLKAITTNIHPQPKIFSCKQTLAFAEIRQILKIICLECNLPLALTWIQCPFVNNLLCIQKSACYVNDQQMEEFLRTCTGYHIQEGQGIAGNVIQSNRSFFCGKVENYEIIDYPLAHHCRKFNLNAAVAIRLRNIFTGDHDHVLEFFFHPDTFDSNSNVELLSSTLLRKLDGICKSSLFFGDLNISSFEGKETYIPARFL